MFGSGKLGGRLRHASVLGVAVLCSGVMASGALAASLSISVKPATPRSHKSFEVDITGHFKHKDLKGNSGKAYLVAWEVSTSSPCKKSAPKELASYGSPYFSGNESKSSFTRKDGFTAGSKGPRHVCAYLYPELVNPSSTVGPIATASKSFHVSS